MRVAILGKGPQAIKLCEWFMAHRMEYSIDAVVASNPEPDWCVSFRNWALERQLPLFTEQGAIPACDLVVSCYYSSRIVEIDRHWKVINLHNAPLPKYRGGRPINWALKNGEKSHGVTIHEVVHEFDRGPIIGQVMFPIWPEVDEVLDVYNRCLRYGWELFKDVLPRVCEIEAIAQDENEATYYSKEQAIELGDRRGWTRENSRVGEVA